MTDDEIIAVVQAHREGKTIEVRTRALLEDWHVTTHPNWNFFELEYRVAPEPRYPREWRISETILTADYANRDKMIRVREVLAD